MRFGDDHQVVYAGGNCNGYLLSEFTANSFAFSLARTVWAVRGGGDGALLPKSKHMMDELGKDVWAMLIGKGT